MNNHQLTITPRVVIQLLIVIVLIPLLPMLISGRWDWWEAWLYAAIHIGGFIISRVLAARKYPDLIAERGRSMERKDAKSWDKILAPLIALGGASILVVAGLDARFGWSPTFEIPVKLIAFVAVLAGWLLGSYALIENRYFSGVVCIQHDRDHHVVSSGPYRWVRHPGYAGALLTFLGTPFLLDSIWAILPTLLLIAALIIRTYLEDKTLHEELAGYADYAQRVRSRLLPGVW